MIADPPPPRPCEEVPTTGLNRASNHGRSGHFGHILKRKKDATCLRIFLQNVGGIGFVTDQRSKETLKMERLKKLITENEFDIMCLTEINKDWRLLPYQETIWAGTNGWRRHRRLQVSQNLTLPPDKASLVGGTTICCMDEVVF